MNIKLTAITMLALGILTAAASALTVAPDGTVVDWGLKPFTQANGSYAGAGVYSTIANDYAPIDFPRYGYVPSPGGSTGEDFDLEEMHARLLGDRLDVLLVNSGGTYEDGFYLGDLMVSTVGGQFAVISRGRYRDYDTGDVIEIINANDVHQLQDRSGTYLYNNTLVENDYGPDAKIRDIAGPWQVKDGLMSQLMGFTADVSKVTYNYGGDEDNTYLIEYSMTIPGLDALLAFGGIELHQTWGCGNDVLKLEFAPEPASSNGTPVPTPVGGAAIAGLLGLMAMRRRRR